MAVAVVVHIARAFLRLCPEGLSRSLEFGPGVEADEQTAVRFG
jgi:hypothetical protein